MWLLTFLFAAFDGRSEDELIGRLKRRDPSAMADLYKRYGKLVYSVILRVVKESGTAEDLAQETFLRIWNRAQFFEQDRGALGPWVLTVARNRAIDYVRSVEARTAQKSTTFEPELENPSSYADLEQDILNSDRARVLRDAIRKLTPNQRVVIEMAYYEGLSQTEMADRMHQPLGTVKTWVRTALKILRNELEEVST